jgi:hypothetical protein
MTNNNQTNPAAQSGPDVPVNRITRGPERREGVHPAADDAPPSINREQTERVPPATSSTGPKTQAGKSRSSQNAVTHGLRAKKIENAVPPSLRHQYETLRRDYQNQYKPQGAIENTLFDLIVFAAWQLYKVREMALYAEIDLGVTGSFGTSEKLSRYRASHERLFFRSLNQLNKIQQERLLRETDQKATLPQNLPPGARLKTLQDHLKRLHRHPKTKTASTSAAIGRKERVSSQYIRPVRLSPTRPTP